MEMGFNLPGGPIGLTFSGGAVAERPSLAVRIALIANYWSMIEAHTTQCLGVLLKTDYSTAMALLTKFQTASQKRQAIEVIAKATLSPTETTSLKDLMKRFEEQGKLRNDIVHGVWGVAVDKPDTLFWAHPSTWTQITLGMTQQILSGVDILDFLADQKAKFVEYDAVRLDEIVTSLSILQIDLGQFAHLLQVESMKKGVYSQGSLISNETVAAAR